MKARPKVLIVDDSKLMRAIIRDELPEENFEVHECESGDKALELLSSGFLPSVISPP